jgi:hypothetical protein
MFQTGKKIFNSPAKQKMDDVRVDHSPARPVSASSVSRRVFGWHRVLLWCSLVGAVLSVYYMYLTSLYLVDEVYDGEGPRELELAEKLTIRVVAAQASTSLSEFVSKYSLCQCVEEVQILWTGAESPPSPTSFVYAHTHSRVSFSQVVAPAVHASRGTTAAAQILSQPSSPTMTESVLLLDGSVKLDCVDIQFAHSVWRSSATTTSPSSPPSSNSRSSTLVGFFPLVHQKKAQKYSVFDWKYVWWNGAYSLMHADGVLVHKALIERLGKDASLVQFLAQRPECYEFALTALAVKERPLGPPVWVNVPAAGVRAPASSISATVRGDCLDSLANMLAIENFPYSTHKSSRANSFLFWSI